MSVAGFAPDGRGFVLVGQTNIDGSYFNPAAGAHGHVMVAGFRW